MDGKMKNIGIITSGGDCGGLNAVIRGAARTALMRGMRTYTIPNGYAGLYNLVNFDHLVELDEERTDHITSQFAGSDAGHSRVKISKINDPDKYDRIMMGLRKHNIDGLVISGGDDTGSVVVDLAEHGIPCVHAPKTTRTRVPKNSPKIGPGVNMTMIPPRNILCQIPSCTAHAPA